MSSMAIFTKKKTTVSYALAVLVFFIHISTFSNYCNYPTIAVVINTFLTKSINMIAVPMFFFLSGLLFFRDFSYHQYYRKIKSRIRTIIIPYLSWNMIWMLFGVVISRPLFSQYFIGRQKVTLSIQNIFEGIIHYKYNGPFWFLFCLIVFFFASPIIYFFLKDNRFGSVAVLFILILKEFHIGLPWPLFESCYSIFYFCLGGWVGIHWFEAFITKRKKYYSIMCWCILVVISVYYISSELIFGGGEGR